LHIGLEKTEFLSRPMFRWEFFSRGGMIAIETGCPKGNRLLKVNTIGCDGQVVLKGIFFFFFFICKEREGKGGKRKEKEEDERRRRDMRRSEAERDEKKLNNAAKAEENARTTDCRTGRPRSREKEKREQTPQRRTWKRVKKEAEKKGGCVAEKDFYEHRGGRPRKTNDQRLE
jgi:hypothetical protein